MMQPSVLVLVIGCLMIASPLAVVGQLEGEDFIIVMPKTVYVPPDRSAAHFKVDVQLPTVNTNRSSSGQFNVNILNTTNNATVGSFSVNTTKTSASEIVDIDLSFHTTTQEQKFILQVVGDIGFEIENSAVFSVKPNPADPVFLHIWTDKPLYKPGGTIKARVFALDQDLHAVTENNMVNIRVRDADQNVITDFDRTVDQGFVDIELPLSDEPILGAWTLTATSGIFDTATTVEVKEYILDRFEPVLEAPSYLLSSDLDNNGNKVVVTVSGLFTFGEQVTGEATVSLLGCHYYHYYSSANCERNRVLHEVQVTLQGPPVDVEFSILKEYSVYAVKLEVVEEGTGQKLDTLKMIPLAYHEIVYKVAPKNTLIEGLPSTFTITAELPDGTPAASHPSTGTKLAPTFTVDASGESFNLKCEIVNTKCDVTLEFPAYTSIYFSSVDDSSATISGKRWFRPSKGSSPYLLALHNVSTDSDGAFANISGVSTFDPLSVSYKLVDSHGYIVSGGVTNVTARCTQNYFPTCTCGESCGDSLTCSVPIGTCPDVVAKYDGWQYTRYSKIACMQPSICYLSFSVPTTNHHGSDGDFTLLVSKVTPLSNVVSDSLVLPSKTSALREMSITLSVPKQHDYFKPGEQVDVELNCGAQANLIKRNNDTSNTSCLVGISAVDKSVLLMGDSSSLTPRGVRDKLYDLRSISEDDTSSNAFGSSGLLIVPSHSLAAKWSLFPEEADDNYGYGGGYILYADAGAEEFDAPMSADSGGSSEAKAVTAEVPQPRAFFPESWLWETFTTSESLVTTKSYTTPDTITSWVFTSVAVSDSGGLALMPPPSSSATESHNELKVFLPFFVEMILPYSVVRGEIIQIKLAVFNFDGSGTVSEAQVQLTGIEDDIEILTSEDTTCVGNSRRNCISYTCEVSENNPCSTSIFIRPKKLGSVKLLAQVTSGAQFDSIEKILLVRPEGIERTYSSNDVLHVSSDNPSDNHSALLATVISSEGTVVPGSSSIRFSVTANLMGDVIDGLGQYIRMPTGCGEQNMLIMGPLVSVRKYLKAKGTLTHKQKKLTEKYMTIGYQRELTYRRTDFGYSAFGNHDSSSSTWLSAFVIRVFAHASSYVYIDPKALSSTALWLIGLQQASGAFKSVGVVIHSDMKGGVAGSELALTAYVCGALVEAKRALEGTLTATTTLDFVGSAIRKAVLYLERHLNDFISVYGSTIVAFVLTLVKSSSADKALNLMLSKASGNGRHMHWKTASKNLEVDNGPPWMSHRKPSSTIEATAYAVMALVQGDRVGDAVGPAEWVSNSRTGRGWSSTQDTIVALEALCMFSLASQSDPPMMLVTVSGLNGYERSFNVTADNADVLQEVIIPVDVAPEELIVTATGTGLVLISASVAWNEVLDYQAKVGKQAIQISSELKVSNEYTVQQEVCFHTDGEATGMAICSVGLFSGYTPLLANTDILAENNVASRVDRDESAVHFYLDRIDANEICITFTSTRVRDVAIVKPAPVSVYDYYDTAVTSDVLMNSESTALNKDLTIRALNLQISQLEDDIQRLEAESNSLKANGNLEEAAIIDQQIEDKRADLVEYLNLKNMKSVSEFDDNASSGLAPSWYLHVTIVFILLQMLG